MSLASTYCLVKHLPHVVHHIYNQIIPFWMTNNLTLLDQYRNRWVKAIEKCLLEMQKEECQGNEVDSVWCQPQESRLQPSRAARTGACQKHKFIFAFPLPLLPDPHSSCWFCHLQYAWMQRAHPRNYNVVMLLAIDINLIWQTVRIQGQREIFIL